MARKPETKKGDLKREVSGPAKGRGKKADMVDDNSLSKWGELIQRQGEQSAARQNERLAELTAAIPTVKVIIKPLDDAALLDYLLNLPTANHDPREVAIWQQVREIVKKQILKRMKR